MIPSIIAGLIEVAPMLIGWIAGDKAEENAHKAVEIAKAVTGANDLAQAEKSLKENPELILAYEKALYAHEKVMLQEETRRIQAVNASIQVEARSEKWPQYSWRPFNGFLFGITIFFGYIGLPLFGKEPVAIPEFVLMAWAAILGVTAWHRGKSKTEAAHNPLRHIIKSTLKK